MWLVNIFFIQSNVYIVHTSLESTQLNSLHKLELSTKIKYSSLYCTQRISWIECFPKAKLMKKTTTRRYSNLTVFVLTAPMIPHGKVFGTANRSWQSSSFCFFVVLVTYSTWGFQLRYGCSRANGFCFKEWKTLSKVSGVILPHTLCL